ncbi:MAG: hypothetical protein N3G80_00155 [Candidatus Micrarchaeota archaeon]|nr:hypothetical protein [Candidatus Micrarchaeota archaeon]
MGIKKGEDSASAARFIGTIHLVIGAYVLVGILLALYLNINIFFISLKGVHPFVMFIAALLAVSDLAEGLLEYLPKN